MPYLQEKQNDPVQYYLLLFLLCLPCLSSGQLPFDPDTVRFEKVSPPELNGVLKNNMYFDSRGILWLATRQGLYAYDGYDWKGGMSRPDDPRETVDQWLQSIIADSLGRIWFGTQTGGLYRLDPATRIITPFPPMAYTGEVLHNLTGHELSFHHGELIIQSHRGYLRFNPYEELYTGKYVPFPELADQSIFEYPGAHALNDIHHFLADADDGIIWLGTAGGLLRYQPADNDLVKCPWAFTNPALDPDESIAVMDIHQSGDSLLIGTYGSGFVTYRKDLSGWSVDLPEPMDTVHEGGAWSNVIQHFCPIDDHTFLFAGSPGCGIYDWSTGQVAFFRVHASGDETYRKILTDRNGRIWTNSTSGIYRSVHPVFPVKSKPHLVLTNCTITDSDNFSGYISTSATALKLRDHQNTIAFSFALAQPLHADDVRYAYQLRGFDRDWVESGNRRYARYANLDGGSYAFQVKATTPDGDVIQADLMSFHIHRLFYRSAWFILACALLVLGALYYIYRVNIDKARLQERLQAGFNTEIARMEMQSLRSQMNPHFIFNSLNSIKNYIISKGQTEAADYVTKFAKLVRVILENSKSDLLTLEQEIHALQLYIEMENMRFEQEFQYSLTVDPGIDQQSFLIPPMLIQPYVENAIWHGLMHKRDNRILDIRFINQGDGIQCVVGDNGIGRQKAAELANTRKHRRQSLGTRITAHRIAMIRKLYHADVDVVVGDNDPTDPEYPGTRVKINIQTIQMNHDKPERYTH